MHSLKAQVTIEYMLAFVLSLALISVSIFMLFRIKNDSDESMNLIKLRGMTDDFTNKVDAVCTLGDGAKLSFATDEKIEAKANVFTFGGEVSGKSLCPFHDNYIFKNGPVTIENFDGAIMLTEVD